MEPDGSMTRWLKPGVLKFYEDARIIEIAVLQQLKLFIGILRWQDLSWPRLVLNLLCSWWWPWTPDLPLSTSWNVEIALTNLHTPITIQLFDCVGETSTSSPEQGNFLSSLCLLCSIPPLSPTKRQRPKKTELTRREGYIIKQVLIFASLTGAGE